MPKLTSDAKGRLLPMYSPWSGSTRSGWDEHPPRVIENMKLAWSELHLRGVILGSLDWLGETFEDRSSSLTIVESWFQHALQNGDQYAPTGEPMMEAVARTVRMDADAKDLVKFTSTYHRGLGSLDRFSGPTVSAAAVHSLMWDEERDGTSQDLIRQRLDLILLRRFSQTQNGFIGMVPLHAQAGDKVCAVAGGRVLYLLREFPGASHTYGLVGECYFHGLMDGEWRDNLHMPQPHEIILI